MIKLNGHVIVPTKFPDGTSQVWKLDPELLRPSVEPVKVEWIFEHEGEIVQLMQLRMLLTASHVHTSLDIRTLPYARQDKPIGNETTFALESFALLLNAMKWGRITLHDPHSSAAEILIENVRVEYYDLETRQAIRMFDADVVCFPDLGAQRKYSKRDILSDYGRVVPKFPSVVVAKKKREQSSGNLVLEGIMGDVKDKRVMIVNDICDGGMTFILVAKALREKGAADVGLFVSHGIFSKGLQPLIDGGISRIFTPEGERTP